MKSKGGLLLLNDVASNQVTTTTASVVNNVICNASTTAAAIVTVTSNNNSNQETITKQQQHHHHHASPSSPLTTTTNSTDANEIEDLLFSIIMLIMEDRVPDSNSIKGYKEGLHVSNTTKLNHQCSIKFNECHVAYQVRTKLSKCIETNSYLSTNKTQTTTIINNNQINNSVSSNNTTSVGSNSACSPLRSPALIAAINTTKRTQSLSPSPSRSSSSSSSSTSTSTTVLIAPINICIDVCRLADCCYDIVKDNLLETKSHNISYELLERWNISIMPNKKNDNKLTFNELFQAIRSYLHFSQISSWLNQTKGQAPKTITYSITCNNDTNQDYLLTSPLNSNSNNNNICDNSNTDESLLLSTSNYNRQIDLKTNFDLTTFPSINIICGTNHLYNLTVNLHARKRKTNLILPPYIYCNKINKCCTSYTSVKSDEDDDIVQYKNDDIETSSTSNTCNYQHKARFNTIMHKEQQKQFITSTPITSTSSSSSSNTASFLLTTPKRRNSAEINTSSNDVKYKFTNILNDIYKNKLQTPSSSPPSTPTRTQLTSNTTDRVLSPIPGERRRLSLDNESTIKQRQPKYLKCYDNSSKFKLAGVFTTEAATANNSDFNEDNDNNKNTTSNNDINNTTSNTNNSNTSDYYSSSQLNEPSSSSNNTLSYSPSSPMIVLSNLSELLFNENQNQQQKVLYELCTSTQTQLHLIDSTAASTTTTTTTQIKGTTPKNSDNDSIKPNFYINNDETNNNNSDCSGNNSDINNMHGLKITTIDTVTNNSNENDDDDDDDDDDGVKNENLILKNRVRANNLLKLATDKCNNTTNNSSSSSNGSSNETTSTTTSSSTDNSDLQTTSSSSKTSSNQHQSSEQIIHFIRSPTDGVCMPIFKNNEELTTNNQNEINEDNIQNSLNENDYNCISVTPNYDHVIAAKRYHHKCINGITKFNHKSGLPLSSSPAPMRKSGSAFDFDKSLKNPKSIKNALSLSLLKANVDDDEDDQQNKPFYFNQRTFSSISSCLLGSFEESLLNGRMNPMGIVDGFYADIGASGSFFPEHVTLPVHAAFYHVCDDVAASPYLGVINLASVGRRGYKVPNKGTIQVTLFNPNQTVVKMFVVMYDLSDMPPNHRTFLRQRTMYVPLPSLSCADDNKNCNNQLYDLKSYLRYLIHLRFATSKSGKLYLHTNIKLIFARNKCEIDPRLAKYEYKTFTEAPKNPRYSFRK